MDYLDKSGLSHLYKKIDSGFMCTDIPEKYDLELASGYTSLPINAVPCNTWYTKADNGLVILHFYARMEDETAYIPKTIVQLATLPAGYRPLTYYVHGYGYCEIDGATNEYTLAYVRTSGALIAHINHNNVINIMGEVIYYTH